MIGQLAVSLGWIWMVMGILSGSFLGMYSFAGPLKTPKGHEDYADLPRRMVRLAHIAMFMLPIITVLLGTHVDALPLSDEIKKTAVICMLICMYGVPVLLIAGSFWLPFKYLEAIPVTCGIVALAIMSYGHFLMI